MLGTRQPPLAAALAAARSVAPAGVEIRAWREHADYAAMVRVFQAARVVDGTGWEVSVASLESDLRGLGLEPTDTTLIAAVDDVVVGWSRAHVFGWSPDEGVLLMHTGHVDPDWRGRGIGRALLVGAQTRLGEVRSAREDPAGTTAGFHSWVLASNRATIALLEPHGYRRLRFMVEMTRTLDDIPDIELPAGLTTRPVTFAERLEVVRAMDEAMHDHRGWPRLSEVQLAGMVDHPTRGQNDVWQVARDGDRVVGGVLGYIDTDENATLGRRRGYTEGIFTVRDWRGRGVASALIARNLRLLRERGMTEAALSVDTENPSGALGLYQRHGFRETDRVIIFRKDLEPAP